MESIVRIGSCLFLSAVFLSIYFGDANSAEPAEIEFRVTDHQAGIEDFHKLDVQLESVAIHPKKAARNEGWVELANDFSFIDIVPLKNGRYVSTGKYNAPIGEYDAIRVRFQSVDGELHTDNTPSLSAKNTIVATSFDLANFPANEKMVLVLDLYVESLTDHEPNLYVVKVREVRVEQ